MGQIVYGSCVELGGMELGDETIEGKCPVCGVNTAHWRYWETVDGGAVNRHRTIDCDECGYRDADGHDEID